MTTHALSAPLTLAVDAALCSPCGIGVNAAVSAVMQIGFSNQAAISAPCEIGGGGIAAALASPLRLAGGDNKAISNQLSIDGVQYTSSISLPMPMTDMSGNGTLSSPLALANPQVINATYSVTITADGRDITRLIDDCTITSSESALFDTVSLSLPDGTSWPLDVPPAMIVITLPGFTHRFMVEEFTGNGAGRTIWGRTEAAIYSDPWSPPAVWNEQTSAATTAAELAYSIALGSWLLDDFPLPPRWEIDGTPAEAVSTIAKAAGGIVISDDGYLSIRRRWPVRPVDMTTAALTISRETAIDLALTNSDTPQYGSIIVQGWSPDALLPRFEVEGSPTLGVPAYVRLYWPGLDHPPVTDWITSGAARLISRVAETVTETVVFTDGSASVAWPIWDLLEFDWLGHDYGDIIWLENGYSTDLELSTPGHGVATITYRTEYERWYLSGQATETVLFGIDISQGAVSANVQLTSGGPAAGEVKEPLLGTTAACVAHAAALLDDSRVRYTVRATIPRTGHIETGAVAWVEDELTAVAGFGKIKTVETKITPSRISQVIEVALC